MIKTNWLKSSKISKFLNPKRENKRQKKVSKKEQQENKIFLNHWSGKHKKKEVSWCEAFFL